MKYRFIHRAMAGVAIAIAVALANPPALAAWPDNKTITIVVPYTPGGTADALARLIGQHLGSKLNTPVVVLNKAGASGVIGQSAVAQAAPDGYTVLYDATPLSINPHLQKLPYDPEKDLQPVSLVAVTPMLVAVPKNSPYNTLPELIRAAKQSPGKITFGSGGQGTVQFMGAELFAQGAGIKMLHVSYKSGMIKPLAITSATRNPAFTDVPTIGESAVKGYEVHEWNGMFVPGSTPADIVKQLHAAIRDVMALPEIKARFDSLGARIVASTPEEFQKYLATERSRWAETVKAAGIKKE